MMLPRLAEQVASLGVPVGLLVVDDGSVLAGGPGVVPIDPRFAWVRVLRLRRNLGHQRAIAVGLCHIEEHIPCEGVVVMDGDGEDRPEDVSRLVAAMGAERNTRIVFGERQRRVERLTFRIFYLLYRLLHWVLTGRGVRVGNFSAIPRVQLESLVVVSELWVHYAAAVLRSRQPWSAIPVTRDRRLDGRSRMNFVALVVHGLSAISVYTDLVFTRIVCATSALAGVTLAGIARSGRHARLDRLRDSGVGPLGHRPAAHRPAPGCDLHAVADVHHAGRASTGSGHPAARLRLLRDWRARDSSRPTSNQRPETVKTLVRQRWRHPGRGNA